MPEPGAALSRTADDDVMLGVAAVLPRRRVLRVAICLTVRAGATVVTVPRFELEPCLALIERHRATVPPAAPPIVLGWPATPPSTATT